MMPNCDPDLALEVKLGQAIELKLTPGLGPFRNRSLPPLAKRRAMITSERQLSLHVLNRQTCHTSLAPVTNP